MNPVESARRELSDALDSENIDRVRQALQNYADHVQKVNMQIAARELMTKLFDKDTSSDGFDDTIFDEVRQLMEPSISPESATEAQDTRKLDDVYEEILQEAFRYREELNMMLDTGPEKCEQNSSLTSLLLEKSSQHAETMKSLCAQKNL